LGLGFGVRGHAYIHTYIYIHAYIHAYIFLACRLKVKSEHNFARRRFPAMCGTPTLGRDNCLKSAKKRAAKNVPRAKKNKSIHCIRLGFFPNT